MMGECLEEDRMRVVTRRDETRQDKAAEAALD